MKKINAQTGISAIGVLLILFVVVIAATFAIKTVPSYFENLTLNSVLQGIAKDYDGKDINPDELKKVLTKRLSINNIRSVTADDITIQNQEDKAKILVNYEVKRDLLANIAIVISFDEMQEVAH